MPDEEAVTSNKFNDFAEEVRKQFTEVNKKLEEHGREIGTLKDDTHKQDEMLKTIMRALVGDGTTDHPGMVAQFQTMNLRLNAAIQGSEKNAARWEKLVWAAVTAFLGAGGYWLFHR